MPETDEGFEVRSKLFIHWFKEQPGATLHPMISLADYRSFGRGHGIVAKEDIPAELELFRIPRQAVLTVENSSLAKEHANFFEKVEEENKDGGEKTEEIVKMKKDDDDDEEDDDDEIQEDFLDPWLRLIVTLMYEHFLGPVSPWAPYLNVLPKEFDTLMFWTEDELAELQASDIRHKIGKASADEMFRNKIVKVIRQNPIIFQTSMSDDELVHLAHRMGSTIMAYSFDLEKTTDDDVPDDGWIEDNEGQTLAMVPMADMLNADAEFNVYLERNDTMTFTSTKGAFMEGRVNRDNDTLAMISIRPIMIGEEILNYYGALPNSDLLRRYGYTSDKHFAHSVAELSWEIFLSIIKARYELKDEDIQKAMSKLEEDEDTEDSFVLEYASRIPDSTGRLSQAPPEFTDLPESIAAQIKAFFKCLRKTTSVDIKPSSFDFWSMVCQAIDTKLSQYPTTVEQDQQILLQIPLEDWAQRRKRRAICVRLEEKFLLRKAKEHAEHGKHEVEGEDRGGKRTKTS